MARVLIDDAFMERMMFPIPVESAPAKGDPISTLAYYNLITFHRGFENKTRYSVLRCEDEKTAGEWGDAIEAAVKQQMRWHEARGSYKATYEMKREWVNISSGFQMQIKVVPEIIQRFTNVLIIASKDTEVPTGCTEVKSSIRESSIVEK